MIMTVTATRIFAWMGEMIGPGVLEIDLTDSECADLVAGGFIVSEPVA